MNLYWNILKGKTINVCNIDKMLKMFFENNLFN